MRWAVAVAVLLAVRPAHAHEAFGDLGPFYANLLHPVADPAQAVLLAGFAAVVALQPLATVRLGWGIHVLTAAASVAVLAVMALPTMPVFVTGLAAGVLGLAALIGGRLPSAAVVALGVAAAIVGALAAERPEGQHEAVLVTFGGAVGLATTSLLLWSLFDTLRRRLGGLACQVVGSWVAAIGIMTAALPR